MLEFESKVKKWGNSFGVIIPKEELKRRGIKENQEVHIIALEKSNTLKESFGMLKGWKITGQEAKDRARRELYHDRTPK